MILENKKGLSWTDKNGTVNANFDVLEKKARGMTTDALQFSIRDCKEAIKANPEGKKAGYYKDEIHVYSGEIIRRRK